MFLTHTRRQTFMSVASLLMWVVVGYLLLMMEFVTVMELTNLPVEVNICTFHTWLERPRCTGEATPRTVSPS